MDSEEVDIRVQMPSHLKALMSDAQLYGWARTRAFHRVWLNQLEQGRCTWFNEEAKMQFRQTLVWHRARSSPCRAFNQGKCDYQVFQGNLQHICAYCLRQ